MKFILKILLLSLLALSLVLALLSCTLPKQSEEDDSWMSQDVEIDSSDSARYARPQEEQEDDAVPQSDNRVTLPFVPLG